MVLFLHVLVDSYLYFSSIYSVVMVTCIFFCTYTFS